MAEGGWYKAGFVDGQVERKSKREDIGGGKVLKDRQEFNKQSWHSRQKTQYIKRYRRQKKILKMFD